MNEPKPPRSPWRPLPPVLLHAPVPAVKQHPAYGAAKRGDHVAARELVAALADPVSAVALQATCQHVNDPVLAPVHALEEEGVNGIPVALAAWLSDRLGWGVEHGLVQTNLVAHTGASGFARLARQASFEGEVRAGCAYVLVDDFIGQGGTLANLRGHILAGGGSVMATTVLTGKPHSATLSLSVGTLAELRSKHGADLEGWWRERFGHGFDCLTESEARYLLRSADAHAIRARLAAEEQG